MSERGEQLAVRFEQQMSELTGFLSGLTESELRVACNDPRGSTVGAVLAHLREGADQVLGWAAGISRNAAGVSPAPAGPGHPHSDPHSHPHGHPPGHPHSHPHGPAATPAETGETIALLERAETALAGIVRGLTDGQLDSCPPAAADLTDGSTPLHQVIAYVIDDVAGHMKHMEGALAGRARLPQEAT